MLSIKFLPILSLGLSYVKYNGINNKFMTIKHESQSVSLFLQVGETYGSNLLTAHTKSK